MPNLDKTGPNGDVAGSGKGRGSCGENQLNGFMRRGRGGKKLGRGMCFRNDVLSLEEQEKFLEKRLKELQAAKKDLESENA